MLSSYAWTGEEAVIINADLPDKTDAILALGFLSTPPWIWGQETNQPDRPLWIEPDSIHPERILDLVSDMTVKFHTTGLSILGHDYGPESQEAPLRNRACNYLMSEELSESRTKIKVRPAGACIRCITWWDKNWIEQQQTAKFHVLHRDMRNTWAAHASGLCLYYNYKEHLLWRWKESPALNWLIHVTLLSCPFLL